MAGRWCHVEGLNPNQREGARLEALGASCAEIAATVGVAIKTVSHWRTLDAYWAAVRELMDRKDEVTMAAISELRLKAMKATAKSLTVADRMLDDDGTSAADVARLGNLSLQVYRALSAQTGVFETPEPVAPDLAEMLKTLSALPPGLRRQIFVALSANDAENEPVK